MNELALFAGAGGGILGGKLLGWRTVCAVEIDTYAASVLVARQNDGCLDPFPVWDDVRTFDGRPWRGRVDVVSGGFPCQDISVAGKGTGIKGSRSGLWSEMARIIREVGPRFVFVENSPALAIRGLGTVLGDLASLGYDARLGVLGTRHAGGRCRRDRLWILASAMCKRRDAPREREVYLQLPAKAASERCISPNREDHIRVLRSRYPVEVLSRDFRGDDVLATRMDRLTSIGNGQDADLVRLAWETLKP